MILLDVYYAGWGEDWRLGQLADDGQKLLFEYSREALAQRLELSPLHLRLRAQAYGGFPVYQYRLPGLMADALPDGWGLLLMDRVFRSQNLPHPGPLERLMFIGERALGALRFAPPAFAQREPDWNVLVLAQHSAQLLKQLDGSANAAVGGAADTVLRGLAVTGGSPQGARPKALVNYDPVSEQVSTRSDAPGAPWLVKFPARGEHLEVCAVERLYADLATACGLEMPASKLFELSPALGPKLAAFGLARFDRQGSLRVPIQSLASLLHADFRQPGSVDYLGFLRATRALTQDEREVQKAYARAVFNAIFHNRDDHPKNFAFCLGRDRRWRLAPAFDLSFSEGPGGQHHMDFAGVGDQIRLANLLQLATAGGLSAPFAHRVIEQIAVIAKEFTQRAAEFPIRRNTVRRMAAVVARCVELALS